MFVSLHQCLGNAEEEKMVLNENGRGYRYYFCSKKYFQFLWYDRNDLTLLSKHGSMIRKVRKEVVMKITAEQFVESLARLSDEEKQKVTNLLVNKWSYLTKSFMGMVDAEMQDQFMVEQAEVLRCQRLDPKTELKFGNGESNGKSSSYSYSV